MANQITYDARPDFETILMSNGLASVFVAVIALSASALSTSDAQRQFAAWVASHDQSLFGLGTVGFDLSELPWSDGTFADDRAFVLRVTAAAKARTGWERLGYAPLEAWLQPRLDQFRNLVEAFVIEHACEVDSKVWRYGKPDQWTLCPVHQVYQHAHGCVLCHDT